MSNPYKIIEQHELQPNQNNLEGKKQLVADLIEFMTEKQLDNLIDGMKNKYNPKKLEGGKND